MLAINVLIQIVCNLQIVGEVLKQLTEEKCKYSSFKI